MRKLTYAFPLCVLALWAAPSELIAQSYLPGPSPTVGPIQHQTVSPFNPSRTDIGIGEKVNLSIDPSTWQDTDIYVDAYGNQTFVADSMGTVTWTASGAGTVYPMVGTSTVLTASLMDADDTVTILATIADSRTMGLDAFVLQGVGFAVKVPKNRTIVSVSDLQVVGTAPPPSSIIGCASRFLDQIFPVSVDFGSTGGQVSFRENLPGDKWTWPNGRMDLTFPEGAVSLVRSNWRDFGLLPAE